MGLKAVAALRCSPALPIPNIDLMETGRPGTGNVSDGPIRTEQSDKAAVDAALIRRVVARDRSAFAELFARYAPKIKSYYLGISAAAPQAEDLMQDVMVTVWRKAESYDPGKASVSTWMFTVARNKFIDQVRRQKRFEELPDVEDAPPSDDVAPDDLLNESQRATALEAALKTLPPDQTEVIVLSFLKEMSHSEIAAELALPLGTVKSRIRLAMNRLRDELEWMR